MGGTRAVMVFPVLQSGLGVHRRASSYAYPCISHASEQEGFHAISPTLTSLEMKGIVKNNGR